MFSNLVLPESGRDPLDLRVPLQELFDGEGLVRPRLLSPAAALSPLALRRRRRKRRGGSAILEGPGIVDDLLGQEGLGGRHGRGGRRRRWSRDLQIYSCKL